MHSTTLYVQEPSGSFRPADTDEIVGAAKLPYEVFAVLYLDSQNHLIEFETPFRGTLNQTSVYPREIVKRALTLNAASLILAHNTPRVSLLPAGPMRTSRSL